MDGVASPTLLLTRPQDASERFLSALESQLGSRIAAVISPILEIVPFENVPRIDPETTLIFTSAHAVAIAKDAGAVQGRRCLTVGQRTADQAEAAGGHATFLGEDVDDFLASAKFAPTEQDALHLRGTHSRGDLAARLTGLGWTVREAEIYDQKSVPLSRAALTLLAGQGPVVLPLFSPRSARLASIAGAGQASLQVFAMSHAVAEAWTGGGDVKVLKNPTADAMLGAVAEAFRRVHLGDPAREH